MFLCITKTCSRVKEGGGCFCGIPTDCKEAEETVWLPIKRYICSEVCEDCTIKSKDIIDFGGEDNLILCHTFYCPVNKEILD